MSERASVGSALRVFGLASLLTGILAGGIAVAFDLEKGLLGGLDEVLPRSVPPSFYWTEGGGMGFSLTEVCGGTPTPPFELLAPLLVPFLLASTLPSSRPITLRLRD